ncbi:hypothetical protein Tco_0071971 [Tanacetum coccineum]
MVNAMNVELQSMKDNEVWILVELPPTAKPLVASGSLRKRPTWMELKPFGTCEQSIRAIRILIAIAAYYDYEIWQMDVKTSFLNGYLNEEFSGGDLKRELRVSCYTDAGYLTDADDLKSQTGYVFVLNGVKFISGLGVVPAIEKPINMYCDNTGAIAIAKESGITKGARHFRAKVHYLREVIEFGDIKLEKVHTDNNLADPFTKALAFPIIQNLLVNIVNAPAIVSCKSVFIIHLDNWDCKDNLFSDE